MTGCVWGWLAGSETSHLAGGESFLRQELSNKQWAAVTGGTQAVNGWPSTGCWVRPWMEGVLKQEERFWEKQSKQPHEGTLYIENVIKMSLLY